MTEAPTADLIARLDALEREAQSLRAELGLRPAEPTTTRRGLVLGAAAGAFGALVGRPAVAGAAPTYLEIGNNNTQTSTAPTGLVVQATPVAYGIGVTDHDLASLPTELGRGAALLGHATGSAFDHGVVGIGVGQAEGVRGINLSGTAVFGTGQLGVVGQGSDTGVTGSGKVGVVGTGSDIGGSFDGERGALLVFTRLPFSPPGNPGLARQRGTLDADPDGGLWHCVASGSPGVWRKLSGLDCAGAFHPVAPSRAYDSRLAQGVLGAGQVRTISVATARDVSSGAALGELVPDGATAITCNVTVVGTTASGFLTLNPGGETTVGAASVNWFAAGQILNNGTVVRLAADRTITVVAGGAPGAATEFVVDVTGWFR